MLEKNVGLGGNTVEQEGTYAKGVCIWRACGLLRTGAGGHRGQCDLFNKLVED